MLMTADSRAIFARAWHAVRSLDPNVDRSPDGQLTRRQPKAAGVTA